MTPRILFGLLMAGVLSYAATPGATGPARASAQLPQPIRRSLTHDSLIALTFDACHTHRPHGYDSAVIRVLRETGTHATLFLCGSWMAHYPEVTKSLGADTLFELGNHTYYHPIPGLVGLRPETMAVEMERTQAIMESLTGRRATLLRPPAGEWDSTVLRVADSLGLSVVLWDVSSGDPDTSMSAALMKPEVLDRVRPGSIVLFHMNTRGWHTAEALPGIIAALKSRGYRLCTVTELLAHDERLRAKGTR